MGIQAKEATGDGLSTAFARVGRDESAVIAAADVERLAPEAIGIGVDAIVKLL